MGKTSELTLFTKTGGPLTKRISLRPDGTLDSDGSACLMSRGVARRLPIVDADELAVLIESVTVNQALGTWPAAVRPSRSGRRRDQG